MRGGQAGRRGSGKLTEEAVIALLSGKYTASMRYARLFQVRNTNRLNSKMTQSHLVWNYLG